MGIPGLLRAFKSCQRRVCIADYAGMTAGIDGYCWLHKGAYGCSLELCTGGPTATTKYVEYFMKRIHVLLSNGVTPLVVLDGDQISAKYGTEENRGCRRRANLEKGRSLLAAGERQAATQFFNKAVDVTPGMAWQLIKALKSTGIALIVAPYEADAQLAYLCREGIVDFVISEDSDLIPFGCQTILFKMDLNGDGDEFRRSRISGCSDLDFTRFTDDMLLDMCILAGCDYLPSLPGMGLSRAHKLVKKFRHNPRRFFAQIRIDGVFTIRRGYELGFKRARIAFRHQRVYDPRRRRIVPMTCLPPALDPGKINFCGMDVPPSLGHAIAIGMVDPSTRLPYIPRRISARPDMLVGIHPRD